MLLDFINYRVVKWYTHLEEKVTALENKDTSHSHDFDHSHDDSAVKILEKEIELLKIQIEEIKVKSSNPLAN